MHVVRFGLALLVAAGGCVLAAAVSAQSVVCCNVPIGVGGSWVGSSRVDNCQNYFNSAPTDVLRRMCEQRQWLACINTARCSELPPGPGSAQNPAGGGATSPPSQGKSTGGGQGKPPQSGTPPKAGTGGGETTTPREFLMVPGSPNQETARDARARPSASSAGASAAASGGAQAVPHLLKSLKVDLERQTGGNKGRGSVELVKAPGTHGLIVQLESSDPHLAKVPASVEVTYGTASADTGTVYRGTFPIETRAVIANTHVVIKARAGVQTLETKLVIRAPVMLYGQLRPPEVCDGNNKGRVVYGLTGPAPVGLKVRAHITRGNPNGGGASYDASETVPAGQVDGTLRIRVGRCWAPVNQSCRFNGVVNSVLPQGSGSGAGVHIEGGCQGPN